MIRSSFSLAAAAFLTLQPVPASAQAEPFIGQLALYGMDWCPRGWTEANGQLLAISENTALFALIGTTYGGDGQTTFALPDLRGRAPISNGQGPGLSLYSTGERVGNETVTLNTTQMPAHSHTITSAGQLNASDGAVNSATAADAALANQSNSHYSSRGTLDETMENGSVTVSSTASDTGGNQSHETRGPRLAMQWCIAMQGIFPSRQ